jgi:hypothetical protein
VDQEHKEEGSAVAFGSSVRVRQTHSEVKIRLIGLSTLKSIRPQKSSLFALKEKLTKISVCTEELNHVSKKLQNLFNL